MSTEPTEPDSSSASRTSSAPNAVSPLRLVLVTGILGLIAALLTATATAFQPVVAHHMSSRSLHIPIRTQPRETIQTPTPVSTIEHERRSVLRNQQASTSHPIGSRRIRSVRTNTLTRERLAAAARDTPFPSVDRASASAQRASDLLAESTALSVAAALDERAGEKVVEAIPLILECRDVTLACRVLTRIRNNDARDPELRLHTLQSVTSRQLQQLSEISDGQ